MAGIPFVLALTVLVGLLVDGWYGWAKLCTRIQMIFSGNHVAEDEVIEMENMNGQNVNINSPTVRNYLLIEHLPKIF